MGTTVDDHITELVGQCAALVAELSQVASSASPKPSEVEVRTAHRNGALLTTIGWSRGPGVNTMRCWLGQSSAFWQLERIGTVSFNRLLPEIDQVAAVVTAVAGNTWPGVSAPHVLKRWCMDADVECWQTDVAFASTLLLDSFGVTSQASRSVWRAWSYSTLEEDVRAALGVARTVLE